MVTAAEVELRPLPDPAPRSNCDGCGESIVWALTTAGPNGPGGKRIPLNAAEDPAGSYAVTHPHRGRLIARGLGRDETADRPGEYLAMPHVATCPSPHHYLVRT